VVPAPGLRIKVGHLVERKTRLTTPLRNLMQTIDQN
jgi:hypothetical protein